MNKIITRIQGGLGNQLFCYSAARRLALANNAELVIDDVTGFKRDHQYHRRYMLDCFSIPARKATAAERLEPFERYRRGLMRWSSRGKPFAERRYLKQEGRDFDERLLALQVKGTLYMDGLWQSEGYFKDAEETIRKDLRIIPPTDELNQRMSMEIRSSNAVALHVRFHDAPGTNQIHNVSDDYYKRAIALMERKIESPRYFLFADHLEAACAKFSLSKDRVTIVSHNRRDENAYADLWLMTLCRHFITAISTFSWWGAWLGGGEEKIVVCPGRIIDKGTITSWNFAGHIPSSWLQI
jgi:hypothetical protein